MIGSLDYADILAEIFKDHDCVIEGDMSLLRHRKIAIHIDDMCSIILSRSESNGSIETSIKSARNMFKSFQIDTVTVFSGINFGTNDQLHQNTLICSHLFWRLLSVKVMHDTASNELNKDFLECYNANFIITARDSYIHYLTALYFFRMIMKVYKNNNYDHIVAPQVTNNQIAFMLNENDVDCIFTDPTAFIYDGVDQIICDFDEKRGKFTYFDIQKLALKLGTTVILLRRVLLALQLYFVVSPLFNKKSKLIECRLKPLPNLLENYQIEIDKRKAIIYSLMDILKRSLRGGEKTIEFNRIVSATFELDKSQISSYYNTIMKSSVINSQGDVQVYPEKRALGRYFSIDISNKEFVRYYSLGYIDDELFNLVNGCTGNTLNIKPTRADSLEADYCIVNFYCHHLQKALYRIMQIAHRQEFDIGKRLFKLKFQSDKTINLDIQEEPMKLWAIKDSRISDRISFLSCINDLCKVWVNRGVVEELDTSIELSEKELLFHVYIHLLDDLMYVNLQNDSLLVLGSMLFKIEQSKFEEEIIIFFELIKLGLVKGDAYNPSNLENTDKLNIPDLNQTTSKSETELSESFLTIPENLSPIQKDFFEGVKVFNKMLQGKNSLTLYQVETTVDKIFESLFVVKKKLQQLNLPNYGSICGAMDHHLSSRVQYIKILSKMTTLSNYDYINHAQLCDFEVYQFTEIVQYITLGLRHSLSSQLLYTFHFSSTSNSLDLLHRVYNRLPFSRYYAAECGALMKIIIVKMILYQFLDTNFGIKLKDLLEEISIKHIAASFNLEARFTQILSNTFSFVSLAIEVCKGNLDAFIEMHDNLAESKQMLAVYMELVGLQTDKIPLRNNIYN